LANKKINKKKVIFCYPPNVKLLSFCEYIDIFGFIIHS